MDLKKKFVEIKTKIKDNAPAIIATVSTGAALALAIANVVQQANHNKELEHANEHLKDWNRRLQAITDGGASLFLPAEDRERLKTEDGQGLIFHYEDGSNFIVTHHVKTED